MISSHYSYRIEVDEDSSRLIVPLIVANIFNKQNRVVVDIINRHDRLGNARLVASTTLPNFNIWSVGVQTRPGARGGLFKHDEHLNDECVRAAKALLERLVGESDQAGKQNEDQE